MELRYMGFDQLQNARAYRFDVIAKGEATRRFVVTVDLGLFRAHHIAIQEGPSLCAQKLAADLQTCPEVPHELNSDDLQAFADAREAAVARRSDARQGISRKPKGFLQSPWRNTPL